MNETFDRLMDRTEDRWTDEGIISIMEEFYKIRDVKSDRNPTRLVRHGDFWKQLSVYFVSQTTDLKKSQIRPISGFLSGQSGHSGADPPEICNLNVKKLPKTWHIFKKNCQKRTIFWYSNSNFPEGQDRIYRGTMFVWWVLDNLLMQFSTS